ncbi:nucleoside phosphatase family-domain-containing protein [Paraphysoderma sedebokerense]|nr:nucleoside phosphatase family-domain-containing protein [Paraphysoderma sedebokerense]
MSPSVHENHHKYGIVIDAGSSGSRIQVYSWQAQGSTGLPKIIPGGIDKSSDGQLKIEPGISTFGGNPHDVGPYLRPLLDFASTLVPSELHGSTPLYVFATAGMRLLPQHQQNEVLRHVCLFLRTHYTFLIDSCSKQIKVITGETEGIYGWVAVNYLLDGFEVISDSKSGIRKKKQTFGFLDMGGASTQIAFEPIPGVAQLHSDDLTEVSLRTFDGHVLQYNVFVTTFLGYGTNEARRRYVHQLITKAQYSGSIRKQLNEGRGTPEEKNVTVVVEDPCLPLGLTYEEDHVSEMPDVSTTFPIRLKGSGSHEQCLAETFPLLNKSVHCPETPCLFNGVHTPPLDFTSYPFVGVSEYWYSSHDFLDAGGTFIPEVFRKRASEFCSTPWVNIEKMVQEGKFPNRIIEPSRAVHQCFKASWLQNVLHEGFGVPKKSVPDGTDLSSICPATIIPPVQTPVVTESTSNSKSSCVTPKTTNFHSVNAIADVPITWTLGAMLIHAASFIHSVDQSHSSTSSSTSPINSLFDDPRNNNLYPSHFVAVLSLCFVVLLLIYFIFARVPAGVSEDYYLMYYSSGNSQGRLGYWLWKIKNRFELLRNMIFRENYGAYARKNSIGLIEREGSHSDVVLEASGYSWYVNRWIVERVYIIHDDRSCDWQQGGFNSRHSESALRCQRSVQHIL